MNSQSFEQINGRRDSNPVERMTTDNRKANKNLYNAAKQAGEVLGSLDEHDKHCKWQLCPVTECPICWPKRSRAIKDAMNTLKSVGVKYDTGTT